ncbi:hypothetical protein KL930_002919 [Ogataea haglerorum]|uniref:Uncharacterized protein n=1 Tax=Ogataea haglerorum TaxID=1937702 RepID=A0AAN6D6C1_9ASCO|nr:hypothetical protein KL915_003788 [Ogataea haglerorum]KAG7694818.1 hypothetical protein KL951_003995 [Ogataea haglerorum]KAG7704619.1 hypothetical protein KL914_004010 [Ogataea haglerorum]KAG7704940.1 hypothetical protein KL950_004113 [Ogataea haglerorum]KAG7719074.1 hypothetical protein KL913_002072 [Ogataea haglerorum]
MVDNKTFLSKFRKNTTSLSTIPLLTRVHTNDTTKSDQSTIFSADSAETAATDVSAPRRFFRVRTNSLTSELMVPVVPPSPKKDPEKLREIKDIAFEVTPRKPQKRNVHPLDQPVLGRRQTEATEANTDNNIQNAADILVTLVKLVVQAVRVLWNLDLFINVALTKDITTRVHVPSLVVGLLVVYVLCSSPSPRYYPQAVQPSGTPRWWQFFFFVAVLAVAVVKLGQAPEMRRAAAANAPARDEDDGLARSESFQYEGFVRRAARYE